MGGDGTERKEREWIAGRKEMMARLVGRESEEDCTDLVFFFFFFFFGGKVEYPAPSHLLIQDHCTETPLTTSSFPASHNMIPYSFGIIGSRD